MKPPKEDKDVYITVPLVHKSKDPAGDSYDLSGVDFTKFLERGYLQSKCDTKVFFCDLVGSPLLMDKKEDHIQMTSVVGKPEYKEMLRAGIRLGCALAGHIVEREGNLIKRLEVVSVGLLPLDQVSDPRCEVTVLSDEEVEKLPKLQNKKTPEDIK